MALQCRRDVYKRQDMEFSDMLTIVGSIMIAKMIAPARTLNPLLAASGFIFCANGRMYSRMAGTMTASPKKPYTTEGIPANSSIAALKSFAGRFFTISAKNTAQPSPVGIPIINAPRVTPRVPAIKGKIPNSPLVGLQLPPKIKLNSP